MVLLECPAKGANKRLVWHVQLGVAGCHFTSPVSLLTNEFDVVSVLHGQVSLAAVNHIYVFHEATNSCKNLKIHKRLAL